MTTPEGRQELKRGVSRFGFFALAFGSMIGVGWVTALGSWLQQAGPGGAMLAFASGGAVMLLIGLCYAELTPLLPVAGGEVAYAYASSGVGRAFIVGWFLAFGYLSVSAFESISVGYVLSYLIPAIDVWPVYAVRGATVYGSHLALGLALTAALTWINYRGVAGSARLQSGLTAAFVVFTFAFVAAGLWNGDLEHAKPWFAAHGSAGAWGGFLAVFVTAPFWFVGFDTIPQAAEEAHESIQPRTLGLAVLLSIAAASLFYLALILSVSMVAPWQTLVESGLPTAEAFRHAFTSPLLSRLVLLSALLGLLTSWNGFFLAGSRVLFAMGRGRILPAAFGRAHPVHGSPSVAVLVSGVVTAGGALLGRGGLLPLVNVGSFAIAAAFLGVALSVVKLRRIWPRRPRPYLPPCGLWPARAAALGAGGILLAMLVPMSPAALAWPLEWLILLGIVAAGATLWKTAGLTRSSIGEPDRARRILGDAADVKDSDEPR